ncbi:hypothetical protein RI054_10g52480 [Pseudoscourfieldia marina]
MAAPPSMHVSAGSTSFHRPSTPQGLRPPHRWCGVVWCGRSSCPPPLRHTSRVCLVSHCIHSRRGGSRCWRVNSASSPSWFPSGEGNQGGSAPLQQQGHNTTQGDDAKHDESAAKNETLKEDNSGSQSAAAWTTQKNKKKIVKRVSAAARAVPQVVSRGARTAKDWASGSFDEAGTRAAAATETTYQRAAAMAVRRAALELERKEAERLIALLRSVQLGASEVRTTRKALQEAEEALARLGDAAAPTVRDALVQATRALEEARDAAQAAEEAHVARASRHEGALRAVARQHAQRRAAWKAADERYSQRRQSLIRDDTSHTT